MSLNSGFHNVRPILSLNKDQAHLRVMGLYRACYRYIPHILKYFDIPKNENDVRMKIRQHFYAKSDVRDIRIIDVLVIKGYMELKEITHQWQQKGHIMAHWSPSIEPKPADFVSKFLAGK